jgi:hypothetical protein
MIRTSWERMKSLDDKEWRLLRLKKEKRKREESGSN